MADEESKTETEGAETVLADKDTSDASETAKVEDDDPAVKAVAREMGWRDRDKYNDKSGKPWVGAREFILRQRDFNERAQAKIEATESTVKEIRDHFDRQLAVEKAKLHEELKARKIEAIKEGDPDEVERIEKEMKTVDADKDTDSLLRAKQLKDWQSVNTWYGDSENEDLTEMADALAKSLEEEGKSFLEILAEIDRKMKRLIPKIDAKKESDLRKSKDSPVEGDTRGGSGLRRHTIRDLSEQQLNVLRIMKREFPDTKDETYIRELEEQGALT